MILLCAAFGAAAQPAELVVQSPPELQQAVTALYAALSGSDALTFADEAPHIVVTSEPDAAALDTVYFLPDIALALQSDSDVARQLMAFAVSPDGQQVLIDLGLLPAVVTVTDQADFTVDIPQPVRGVVSPYSLATYMVYVTGASDRLLAAGFLGARDPQGAAAMERIDPRFPELAASDMNQNNPNVEEIARLAPDVIFSSARADWLEPVDQLGIPIVRFQGESIEALKEAVLLTGQILGPDAAHRAQLWVDYYDRVVSEVLAISGQVETPLRVLFTGTQPTRVASGEMYQSAVIAAAGGVSVTSELTGYWNDVNLEQIALWNPDVILVPPYGGASVEAITENTEWQLLDAVRNKAVYRVPKLVAPWDTPTPDSVLGVIWLAQLLHPDLFQLDCPAETRYFYNTFYDYAISDEEIAMLCGQP
ncbi:MAG: ABC transporter substrate-binding protein [Aggregatilineales bacterium]